MQRKQEAEIRKQLENERQRAINEAHWVLHPSNQEENGFVSLSGTTLLKL